MQRADTGQTHSSFRTLEAAVIHHQSKFRRHKGIRLGSGNIVIMAGSVKLAQCNIASHHVIDRG